MKIGDLYRINDVLTNLAAEFRVDTSADDASEKLNDLTHQFAQAFGITPAPQSVAALREEGPGGGGTSGNGADESGAPRPTATVTGVPGPAPTRKIPVRDAEPGMVLVGEFGGRAYVTGEVGPSVAVPGTFLVEVEHGLLHLDPDTTIEVLIAP